MRPETGTHALLRPCAAEDLVSDGTTPAWVAGALARAPWVVVRRAGHGSSLIPIGVRGGARHERHAAWVAPQAVLDCVTPPQLAARGTWRTQARRSQVAALAALDTVESIMQRAGLGGSWGPGGSVGFELASGVPTVGAASDLDLVLYRAQPWECAAAAALEAALSAVPVRVDVLVEMPQGAVALAEYGRARPPYLLRTPTGPRLTAAPWSQTAAAA